MLGMVVVLRDHVAQRAAAHFFEGVVSDARAAPGNLLPHEKTKAVAEFEYAARLLIMREADEVGADVLDELHLLGDQLIGHRGGIACMVFVAMRSAQKETLSIQLEGAVLDELGVADPEGLLRDILRTRSAVKRDAALVEMRIGRAPKMRSCNGKAGDLRRVLPGFHGFFRAVEGSTLRIRNIDGELEGISCVHGVVQRAEDRHSCG